MLSPRTIATISALCIIFYGGIAHAQITRTLRLGMRGEDVRELQVLLNADPDTRISTVGAGSPGLENTYFGMRTMQAVIHFQEKYASDTLAPAGRTNATGIVGFFTRAKMAKLRVDTEVPISPVVSTTPVLETLVIRSIPKINAVTPSVVTKDAEMVTLHGSFDPTGDNSVVLSSEAESGMYGTVSLDGTTLSFLFSFSLAQKLREQLGYSVLSATTARTIVENLSGPEVEKRAGKTYARVILIVKNSYGESSPYTLSVDLASLLSS